MAALQFATVSFASGAALNDINVDTKSVLIIGEKASVLTDKALPLAELALPTDFVAPIANNTTECITAYLDGRIVTVATFSHKRSRTLGPVRGDAIHELLDANPGKGNTVLIVLLTCEEQVLPALKNNLTLKAIAVARAFPLYSNKQKKDAEKSIRVHFVLGATIANISIEIEKIQTVADAVREAGKLVDMPPNELNTKTYLEFVQRVWSEKLETTGTTITVIAGKELEERGFEGIWNVGKGSQHPPVLIVLSHIPSTTVPVPIKSVAWVGKGITFDAGGLSIKVSGGMVGMKTDMGGTAAILEAFVATVTNRVNTNFALHAVLCVAENSVDARSFRPDDIITCYSGKTVEVMDTDAEGRLCLMDGVAYASKDLAADVVVDMATLTGAQYVATGNYHAGFISNCEELEKDIITSGKKSGDLCYPMVYAPEFLGVDKALPSKVADMINWKETPASSSVAGMFVGAHLVPDEKWVEGGEGKWAHIDIAFPSVALDRGSGFGVGVLYSLAEELNEKWKKKESSLIAHSLEE
ncbi:putative aminopeptidase npepl1 [Physocladia obscura]|uniref:Aminopeptidase npepl1 n=1 Tax=Physocladia obscura TaxID=109957 RepID=A0AAD5SW46_9FUNG|nr:putative aminopeptidase npepl1 [Physocladia obscura]